MRISTLDARQPVCRPAVHTGRPALAAGEVIARARPPVNQTSGLIGESERRAPTGPPQGHTGQSATLWASPERTRFRTVLAISRKFQAEMELTGRNGCSGAGVGSPKGTLFRNASGEFRWKFQQCHCFNERRDPNPLPDRTRGVGFFACHFVSDRVVAFQPLFEHAREHWYAGVNVIVDLHHLLPVMESMEPTDILL